MNELPMTLRSRLFSHHILSHPELTGYSALTINYLVMTLAMGMVSTFSILFVYKLGATPLDGLKLMFLFFFFQRVVVALAAPAVGMLAERIGIRWVIVCAEMTMIAKLLIFSSVLQASWVLIPALIFGGVSTALYYIAFHALVVTDESTRRIGEQFGMIAMIGEFADILSPLLAGLLIEAFGFSQMFLVAIVLLGFSLLPLLLMRHQHKRECQFSWNGMVEYVRHDPTLTHAVIWRYIEDAILTFFWPIYLFLVVKSYAVVGAIGSATAVISAVMVYLAGRMYDRRPLRRLFPALSFAVGISWVMRFLSVVPATAAMSDAMHRLFSPFWSMKIRRAELAAGEKVPGLSFGVIHELLVSFGALAGLLFGFAILVGSGSWFWLIVPSGGAVLLSAWLMKEWQEKK